MRTLYPGAPLSKTAIMTYRIPKVMGPMCGHVIGVKLRVRQFLRLSHHTPQQA